MLTNSPPQMPTITKSAKGFDLKYNEYVFHGFNSSSDLSIKYVMFDLNGKGTNFFCA
jgi:hypothetical protein